MEVHFNLCLGLKSHIKLFHSPHVFKETVGFYQWVDHTGLEINEAQTTKRKHQRRITIKGKEPENWL